MVKRLILLFLMVLCMTTVSFAQTCRDKNNMTIGKIESDGTVRNASNMKIGTVERNGTVRDKSNMKIGSADGVNPTYAAVFFFFILFNR